MKIHGALVYLEYRCANDNAANVTYITYMPYIHNMHIIVSTKYLIYYGINVRCG